MAAPLGIGEVGAGMAKATGGPQEVPGVSETVAH